ncbi:hypothetical protein KOL70_03670 [Pantoea sp. B270]|uniref:hypothetical protein n=1 Tax=Pantoea TaxID=53335 RepID=UPI000F6782AB|nr:MULTISPECIES: hypothetical protein [Pantoea]MBU6517097.1 hypothetical protein [Pantoea sp. B270]
MMRLIKISILIWINKIISGFFVLTFCAVINEPTGVKYVLKMNGAAKIPPESGEGRFLSL